MNKTYFKPVSEILISNHESLLLAESKEHDNDWVGGKDDTPDGNGGGNNNDENGDQDIWNSHFNIWD